MIHYHRIARIEVCINTLDYHGACIISYANGEVALERLLTGFQIDRIKQAVDGIVGLNRKAV